MDSMKHPGWTDSPDSPDSTDSPDSPDSPVHWLCLACLPACIETEDHSIYISGHPQPYSEEGEDLYDYEAASDDLIDDGDNSDGGKRTEMVMMSTPKFISQAQSVLVNEGETIRLPCMVDRLEGFVMLWKKNKDIITVASQIIDKVIHHNSPIKHQFKQLLFREFA